MATLLFFDDWPLSSLWNVRRVMGKPKWVPEATLEDPMTEGTFNFPSVWFDSEAGLWKAIYCATWWRDDVPSDRQRSRAATGKKQLLFYAESDDGIHWKKPDLSGIASFPDERRAPNHVFSRKGHMDGGPVFYDARDPDPQRRLKYLFAQQDGEGHQGMAVSADGRQWRITDSDFGAVPLDAPIAAFYNRHRETYTISKRFRSGDRRVAFVDTPDFVTLGPPRLAVHPGPLDPPMAQLYGMPVYPYEDIYIGLLWRLHTDPGEISYHKLHGPMDCVLTYSVDGSLFNRTFNEPFIAPNERGEHGGGHVNVSCLWVDDEHTIRFYSGGSKAEHFQDQSLNDAALMLHTLRLDGFFRLESCSMRGWVMTRPLRITGDDLRLNVRAPHGVVRAGFSELNGEPIPGFGLQDCRPFIGDALFWQPQFTGGPIRRLGDRTHGVHLTVEMESGELYAVRGDFQLMVGHVG